MVGEHHLILHELSLRPSGEWTPESHAWTGLRVAEGAGYCLQGGSARELNANDALMVGPNHGAVMRASQLGVLKLEFFLVLPQYLNGVLTVAEWHQLERLGRLQPAHALHFGANELTAQKFTRLVAQPQRDGLANRLAMLQLWAAAIAGVLAAADTPVPSHKLSERFRQFVGQISEAELASSSLPELAAQLHCSERHFSRLFHGEFGVPLRVHQTELRLQRALQLLADADAKIINVAYESGYRHLGLFNAMFKKRFGVTPSEWRRQNLLSPPKKFLRRSVAVVAMLWLLMQVWLPTAASAQTLDTPAQAEARAAVLQKLAEAGSPESIRVKNPPAAISKPAALAGHVNTNAGPQFKVEKYLVSGNSVLKPEKLGEIFTNVPNAFGTNVTFTDIRAALGDLQMAYRERGFVTVSVSLPPQKLTNAEVKIKVTEGRLAAINVKGNQHFSTENVLRALPSLHTNMLLNSHVFQRELDLANANRDRQIYPVIGPGLEPGTSELTLKVKDRFPLHARVELNNQATPGTPDSRVSFNAQYGNLWDLEHQVGVQYSFTPITYGSLNNYYFSPLDLPTVANYSAYYRIPLGRVESVQKQIDNSAGHFGYNEVTHQFQLPPSSGRPELTIYASRSVTDTGLQRGPNGILAESATLTNSTGTAYTPVQITTNSAGQSITLNEGIGMKFSLPLPQIKNISSVFSFGADFKRYQQVSYNTNENFFILQQPDSGVVGGISTTVTPQPQPQKPRPTAVDYFPINVGISGSMPDPFGSSSFNAQANYNIATVGKLSSVSYTTKADDNYFTLQMGASREQRLYKDWAMLIRADGQWASTPLFSNEQYAMGGVAGVRGYTDGEAYGDTGWRVMLEPRTPLINIGMVDGDVPFWLRLSVFMDYGRANTVENHPAFFPKPGSAFWGAGSSITANIGNHLDARLTLAFPLLSVANTSAGDLHVYFGVGAQF
jgi:hemolysin activation/secretion protein/AraC-like DNA-binding protein